MPNLFYSEDKHRATRVRELFAAIAPRYDLLNDIQSLGLHRFWKRRLVQLAGVQPDDPVLDICCGTGDLSFMLARKGARVVGLDFSEPMLDAARRRVCRSAASQADETRRRPSPLIPEPEFIQGDAMQLPFSDGSFAAVTVGYGLRNLEDWRRGVEEMVRVAKPGGRILVLDFGKPDNALLRWCYFAYLRRMVPVFGWLFCGNSAAYAYILESLHHYPAQRGVEQAMQSMKLSGVRVENLLGGMMSINLGVKPGGE